MDEFNRETPEDEKTEINLTPMLDVVFIMLIFFIVTAVFIKEPGIEITRPQASTAKIPTSSIYVAISQDNEVWLSGDSVELASLSHLIERLHTENPASGLIIQADADANNKTTIAVMDAARTAGIPSVVLAAERP